MFQERGKVIFPEEISAKTSLRYLKDEKDRALATLPGFSDLHAVGTEDELLVYGPPEDLSLGELYKWDSQLFLAEEDSRYWTEECATSDKVAGGRWLAIETTLVPDSTFKTLKEQQALLGEGSRLPNVAELAYALLVYRKVRSSHLLQDGLSRTSSHASGGTNVCVGNFSMRYGLQVLLSVENEARHSHLGIVRVREVASGS